MPEIGWILWKLDARAAIDIAVVAAVIYGLLGVARGTRSAQIIRGLVIVTVVMWVASRALNLTAVGFLLSRLLPVIVLAIPIIFQPELRRLLEQIGHTGWLRTPFPTSSQEDILKTIDEIARACSSLSRSTYGALIVIERETGLQDYADRGVALDAQVTSNLLVSLFFPNSPLHDGAVIIRDSRVVAATVVLPLTENIRDSARLGTRHRAAIGITEESDALAVVVSEETGRISVAHHGRLVENLDQERLRRALRTLMRLDQGERPQGRTLIRPRRRSRRRPRSGDSSDRPSKPTEPARSSVSWEAESDD